MTMCIRGSIERLCNDGCDCISIVDCLTVDFFVCVGGVSMSATPCICEIDE